MTATAEPRADAGAPGPLRVLYTNHVTEISGAENSLLALLTHLDRERFSPILALPEASGPLAERAQALGVPVHGVPFLRLHKTGNPLTNLRQVAGLWKARRAIGKLCRAEDVRVVHANSFHSALACAMKGPRIAPVIWHVRDVLMPREVVRWLAGRVHRMIAVSGAVAKYMVAIAPEHAGKVVLVHNGIDTEALTLTRPPGELRAELGVPDDAPLVACVGQLVPWKRQDILIEAAQSVARVYPQAHFAIVGADMFGEHADYVGKLKKLAADGAANVRFLGYRPDALDIIAAADVLAHPATAEPLGRVVLEAMAVGTPVVAANAGGPAELLEDAESGLLVEPADPKALSEGLLWLLENPGYGAELAEKARERVVANFSAQGMARKTEAVYREVLRQ
jgi:glycosyltransferase involved in cell wall biosynthesis